MLSSLASRKYKSATQRKHNRNSVACYIKKNCYHGLRGFSRIAPIEIAYCSLPIADLQSDATID